MGQGNGKADLKQLEDSIAVNTCVVFHFIVLTAKSASIRLPGNDSATFWGYPFGTLVRSCFFC